MPEGPSPLPHINQSPMHLQSPRTLESVTVMHMSLMFNSFGASSSSVPDRSVKAEPIGKASNAKALINRGLCSHNLTIKAFACRPCMIDSIVNQPWHQTVEWILTRWLVEANCLASHLSRVWDSRLSDVGPSVDAPSRHWPRVPVLCVITHAHLHNGLL